MYEAVKRFVLDIFFPIKCPFCGQFIKWNLLACEKCVSELPFADNKLCSSCGKAPCICGDDLFYDTAYVSCYYTKTVPNAIYKLKDGETYNVCKFFSDSLSRKIIAEGKRFDFIIAVPMAKRKEKLRGYNQADKLAKEISKETGIPIVTNMLFKKFSTIEQHSLSAAQRVENLKGAYYIKPCDLTGKSILIVDDVMTTTLTINYCAHLLKSMGAEHIAIAVIATTVIKKKEYK